LIDQKKDAEREIELDFLHFLQEDGLTPEKIARKVEEAPDLLFSIDGQRIACEITRIPGNKIIHECHRPIKTTNMDGQGAGASSTTWAYEPHIWIAEIVQKKSRLIRHYKSNTNPDQLWLVIHVDRAFATSNWAKPNWFLVEASGWQLSGIKHWFDRIFIHFSGKKFIELNWASSQPEKFPFELPQGYPVEVQVSWMLKLDVPPTPGLSYDFCYTEVPILERFLPPKCKVFRSADSSYVRPVVDLVGHIRKHRANVIVKLNGKSGIAFQDKDLSHYAGKRIWMIASGRLRNGRLITTESNLQYVDAPAFSKS